MTQALTTENFTIAATVVASTAVGIFVKSASRRDKQKFFLREDFAVGLDLLVCEMIILVSKSSDPGGAVSSMDFLILFFALFTTSTWIRRCGWQNYNRLKFGNGVLIPDAIGIVGLSKIVFYT